MAKVKAEVKPKQKRALKILFEQKDIELLIVCALKEQHILENKGTDNPASQMKNEAWERIAEDFNATTSGAVSNRLVVCAFICGFCICCFCFLQRRTINSLREKYTKIKGDLRKSEGIVAKHSKGTGGGGPAKESTALTEPLQELSSLLSLSIHGRKPTIGDSDEPANIDPTENSNISIDSAAIESCMLDDSFGTLDILDTMDDGILVEETAEDGTIRYITLSSNADPVNETETSVAPNAVNETDNSNLVSVMENSNSNEVEAINPNPIASHHWLKGNPPALKSKMHPLLKHQTVPNTKQSHKRTAHEVKLFDLKVQQAKDLK